MVTQELLDYIATSLRSGRDIKEITDSLLSSGWQQSDIDEAYLRVVSSSSIGLLSISHLFSSAWMIYKQKFKTFIGIMLVSKLIWLASFLPIIAVFLGHSRLSQIWFPLGIILFVLTIIIPVVINIVFSLCEAIALVYAVSEGEPHLNVFGYYKKAFPKLLPYWWILFLEGLVIAGGFLLFIIPGFIYLIWFWFSIYILLFEDIKGSSAFLKSREYIRGYWWAIFIRFVFMALFSYLLSWAISFLPTVVLIGLDPSLIFKTTNLSSIATPISALFTIILNQLLPFILTPLMTAYSYLIYSNLRNLKRDLVFTPKKGKILLFFSIGILGILEIIIFFTIFLLIIIRVV